MKKLSGCKVVNRSGFCEECENEYKLNDGNFCELRNITLDQNCLKLNGKLCKKCREGYFVNHFGNCTQRIEHCERYKGTSCFSCEARFYLNS